MQPIILPVNKKRLRLHLLGAATFVAIGIWFLISPPVIDQGFFRTPGMLRVIGAISLLVFGYFGFEIFRKLREPDPMIRVDEKGITDTSTAVAAGFIPWEDVTAIQEVTQNRQRMFAVQVRNPEVYIARQQDWVRRKLVQSNLKLYGTPVVLSATLLQGGYEALKAALTAGWAAPHR